MWKRSFGASLPSKSESGRCENEAFVRDFPPKVKAEDVKMKLSFETPPEKLKAEDAKNEGFVRDLLKSCRCESEAFVRDFPQNLKVEDVETRLSCQTSFKI